MLTGQEKRQEMSELTVKKRLTDICITRSWARHLPSRTATARRNRRHIASSVAASLCGHFEFTLFPAVCCSFVSRSRHRATAAADPESFYGRAGGIFVLILRFFFFFIIKFKRRISNVDAPPPQKSHISPPAAICQSGEGGGPKKWTAITATFFY